MTSGLPQQLTKGSSMFSGIIEAIGEVVQIEDFAADKQVMFNAKSLNLQDIQLGDSININGVCLSVIALQGQSFTVDISTATLACTTFSQLAIGDRVNVEKALQIATRFNGHIVSGHVDGVGIIQEKNMEQRSQRFLIAFPEEIKQYICKKGSICVDGVSLTINAVDGLTFTTNIIPHTQAKTIFSKYALGTYVNLEVDIVARYMESLLKHKA